MHNCEGGKPSSGGGKKWILLLLIVPLVAFVFLSCGKDSNEPYTGGEDFIKRGWKGWTAGWTTSWTKDTLSIPVSRDGRYAYFTTKKSIGPDGGAWGKKWKSPKYRGRVDLVTGEIDTGIISEVMRRIGSSGLIISRTVSDHLSNDSVFGASSGRVVRQKHGYGDGRYVIYIRSPSHTPDSIITYLIDSESDTYRIIGTQFRDGWLDINEKAVLLVDAEGQRWGYEIGPGNLAKVESNLPLPNVIRGLGDLSEEKIRIAREAMALHTESRIYRKYPKNEEF